MTGLVCSNCDAPDAQRYSFDDLDLPTVTLCGLCSVTIVAQPDMFAEMGKRAQRRRKRTRKASGIRTDGINESIVHGETS